MFRTNKFLVALLFLGSIPLASSEESNNATEQIRSLQKERVKLELRIAELRKKIPARKIKNYAFGISEGGKTVKAKLSTLFGKREYLLVLHNMGSTCPICTAYAGAFSGALEAIEGKFAFGVVSAEAPDKQKALAVKKGWRFKMYSSSGNAFAKEMGFENETGRPRPGLSLFQKKGDDIFLIDQRNFFAGDKILGVLEVLSMAPRKKANADKKDSEQTPAK